MIKFMGLVSLAIVLVVPTATFAETYDCKIRPKEDTYWTPRDLVIDYDPSTASVVISDHIIKEYKGGKHKGKLKSDNAKRTSFTWNIRGIQNSKNQYIPELAFTASYLKKKGLMIVTTRPLGYGDVFYGKGRCKVTN